MKIVACCVFLLFVAISSSAQVRQLKLEGDLCVYTARYDAKRYSAVELRNTWELISSAGSAPFATWNSAFKPADVAALNPPKLKAEYTAKLAKLKTLDIVDNEYFESFRRRKIREIEAAFRKEYVYARAFADTGVLLEFDDAPACTQSFARPIIAGGDDLLAVWRTVNLDLRKRNGDPERIRREFESQMASPDKMKYALVETMTFGWGNCANASVPYVQDDQNHLAAFKKLFRSFRSQCEQP